MDAGLFQQPKYQVEARAVEGTSARHIEACRCRSSRPSEENAVNWIPPSAQFPTMPSFCDEMRTIKRKIDLFYSASTGGRHNTRELATIDIKKINIKTQSCKHQEDIEDVLTELP